MEGKWRRCSNNFFFQVSFIFILIFWERCHHLVRFKILRDLMICNWNIDDAVLLISVLDCSKLWKTPTVSLEVQRYLAVDQVTASWLTWQLAEVTWPVKSHIESPKQIGWNGSVRDVEVTIGCKYLSDSSNMTAFVSGRSCKVRFHSLVSVCDLHASRVTSLSSFSFDLSTLI